jgi:SPX domain protein involved in polyphosphate accumulation
VKPTNFRGRKNARRVNALAEKQQQVKLANEQQNAFIKTHIDTTKTYEERESARESAVYLDGKIQRLQRDAENISKKIMEQGAAEAVRTKKNRQGFQRQR